MPKAIAKAEMKTAASVNTLTTVFISALFFSKTVLTQNIKRLTRQINFAAFFRQDDYAETQQDDSFCFLYALQSHSLKIKNLSVTKHFNLLKFLSIFFRTCRMHWQQMLRRTS